MAGETFAGDKLTDLQNALGDEDDEKDEKDIIVENEDEDKGVEGDDKEEDEGSEKDNKEDEDESEEDRQEKEDKDNKKSSVVIPQFKEITKKYPTLFKDFPHLRHAFFHAKEYRELFPTVEDAKEAIDSLENFKSLEESLGRGELEDIVNTLESLKGLGDDVVPNLALSFLSSIKKIDQDLYYKVITPELVNFTRSMFNAGLRNENDNLKNAALVAAKHFFDDPKVASGEKDIKLPERETKKDDKLELDRQNFKRERYTVFYNDVVGDADTQLSEIVLDGLDPKSNMSEGMKELVVEKVLKEISKTLSSNSAHTARMNSLWKKANDNNFSSPYKSKIITAYLEAAKEVMPRIRSKIRANVLGIRDRHSDANVGGNGQRKRVEPGQNNGNNRGERGQSSNKDIDPNKIDWKKTSDLDYIAGRVTLKK